ncbi:hypothetical protein [Aquariibacter albus]|uniref:Lipoprotein n=1 Tax=Aquariibacter albus TaxID=2759899 RepID=A0A839HJM8_9BURK|nr:hypothetical protein [Aquariibacter albus]MBB1161826.1 hypothetical protein [Aquariibacter albus]
MRVIYVFAAITGALASAGCTTLNDAVKSTKYSSEDPFGDTIPIGEVDLIELIKPGARKGGKANTQTDKALLEQVLAEKASPFPSAERNRIQDRIIMASNSRCEEYKTILKRKQSNLNFWYGSAATFFGAAGAVTTGGAASYLSALSGTASGVRAEANHSFYADVAAQVIVKGISKRRSDIMEKIFEARKDAKGDYTLEGAIADAITYHGACSLIGGLEQADGALGKYVENTGLDALFANKAFAIELERKATNKAKQAAPEGAANK